MESKDISGDMWAVSFVRGEIPPGLTPEDLTDIPAHVPGGIHTDLVSAKKVEAPYLIDEELKQRWIGKNRLRFFLLFSLALFHLLLISVSSLRLEVVSDFRSF